MPRATVIFFALAFVVFTCVEPYLAPVNNPNENVRTYLTMAIVEHHTFRLDEILQRHAWVNDMAKVPDNPPKNPQPPKPHEPPRPDVKTHYASVKGPATSYLGVPFYWAFTKIAPRFGHPIPTLKSPLPDRAWWLRAATFTLRLCSVQIPCFLFLVWFERWLRRTTDDIVLRLSAVAAVGFGTNYLAYALMYVSHATFAVAAFASFGLTMHARLDSLGRSKSRKVTTAFFAGLFAGLVTLLEYHALAVSVILAVYGAFTFYRPKRFLAFTLGGLVSCGALANYQAKACGSWKSSCHKYTENFPWLHTKYLGLGKPDMHFLREAMTSHAFGFFGLSPFMWLGLLAIPFGLFATYGTRFERRERRIATFVWMLAMVGLALTFAAASNPHGGWSVGPRYFGAAPPFFAFGAVLALERIAGRSRVRRIVVRALAGGLALASAAEIGVISLLYNTLPETVARPFARLGLLLAWGGFVPYHAGQLFGWMSPTGWYIVAGCMFAATGLAAAWPSRDTPWSWTLRVASTIAIATYGLLPAFSTPGPKEPFDPKVVTWLATTWEPPGRDRLHKLRDAAEKDGAVHPCLWWKVIDLEKLLIMTPEVAKDEKRATVPRSQCR